MGFVTTIVTTISADQCHVLPTLPHPTPENVLPCPIYKLQKCTISNLLLKSCRNTVLLWYLFRGRSLHSKTHVLFLKPGDVFNSHVNLKIQLTHLHQIQSTHPTHISPHFINCVNFSHNSPKTPKITSILTSIKPLYFLVKLNCQTI